MALTKRQKQVLDFIAGFVDDNGCCPSFEEIARGRILNDQPRRAVRDVEGRQRHRNLSARHSGAPQSGEPGIHTHKRKQ